MVYFKTSEQKIWDAICTISNIKWGVISASLNFQIKKSEKTPVLHLMYQVSTFYDEKSLSNQKKHLQLLKVMLQIGSFNCPESNANNFSCTAFRKFKKCWRGPIVLFFLKNKAKHLEILFYNCVPKKIGDTGHVLDPYCIGLSNAAPLWRNYVKLYFDAKHFKIHNHMRCSSWETKWDRQKFLSFWTNFCPFCPLTTRKITILKKWNKHLEMPSFYTCVPKITIIWCMLPEIWSTTDIIFVILGHFLHFYPTIDPKN